MVYECIMIELLVHINLYNIMFHFKVKIGLSWEEFNGTQICKPTDYPNESASKQITFALLEITPFSLVKPNLS